MLSFYFTSWSRALANECSKEHWFALNDVQFLRYYAVLENHLAKSSKDWILTLREVYLLSSPSQDVSLDIDYNTQKCVLLSNVFRHEYWREVCSASEIFHLYCSSGTHCSWEESITKFDVDFVLPRCAVQTFREPCYSWLVPLQRQTSTPLLSAFTKRWWFSGIGERGTADRLSGCWDLEWQGYQFTGLYLGNGK